MPEIVPFEGLRYSIEKFGKDWSSLIAPPYDVLTAEDKQELQARDERNIVSVDLPHVPPKTAGPDEVYQQAARTLQQWINEKSLVVEDKPALYVYHQEYEHNGQSFVRQKFFARLRLEEFGTGTVFPHEQTFGGPKEDRLKLMQATRCQLSAVFGLYSDPDQQVSKLLDVRTFEPTVTATMENVTNRLWVFSDPQAIAAVQKILARKPVYIADGHHRYGTALMYRNQLIAEQGDLPPEHPARFLLIGLCAMEDPGAVILPTHRVISDFGGKSSQEVLAAMRKGMDIQPRQGQLGDPESLLPEHTGDDLTLYLAEKDQLLGAKFTNRKVLDELAPNHSQAWRDLDLAYLHRYVLDGLVSKGILGDGGLSVNFLKTAAGAIDTAKKTNGIALLTRACSMEALKAVSDAGDLMPQKSTYFYPKLATGLVLNPLV